MQEDGQKNAESRNAQQSLKDALRKEVLQAAADHNSYAERTMFYDCVCHTQWNREQVRGCKKDCVNAVPEKRKIGEPDGNQERTNRRAHRK